MPLLTEIMMLARDLKTQNIRLLPELCLSPCFLQAEKESKLKMICGQRSDEAGGQNVRNNRRLLSQQKL